MERKCKIWAPKVTTGCITCKMRRVKCDEGKPLCTRCIASKRKCDGYAPPVRRQCSKSRSASTSPTYISPKVPGVFKEQRAFHYFTTCTARGLSGSFSSNFWERVVPQMCLGEPSLRFAAVAVASMHEAFSTPISSYDSSHRNSIHLFGLSKYASAVHELNQTITANPERLDVILVTCALLVCYENIRGNHQSALTHLNAAMKIIELHKVNQLQDLSNTNNPFGKDIIPLFTRLGLQAGYFVNSHLSDDVVALWRCLRNINSTFELEEFQTIDEARDALDVAICKLLADLYVPNTSTSAGSQEHFNHEFTTWNRSFMRLIQRLGIDRLSIKDVRACVLLKFTYFIVTVMANRCLYFSASSPWHLQFGSLVNNLGSMILGAQPTDQSTSLCSDLGVITLLYFVVSRCPNDDSREGLLTLMQEMWTRERAHDTATLAKASETILYERSWDIDDRKRDERKMELQRISRPSGQNSPGDIEDRLVIDFDLATLDDCFIPAMDVNLVACTSL